MVDEEAMALVDHQFFHQRSTNPTSPATNASPAADAPDQLSWPIAVILPSLVAPAPAFAVLVDALRYRG